MKRRTFIKTATGVVILATQGATLKLFGQTVDSVFDGFQSPGRDYSPVPLWWWDGDRLDKKTPHLATGGD